MLINTLAAKFVESSSTLIAYGGKGSDLADMIIMCAHDHQKEHEVTSGKKCKPDEVTKIDDRYVTRIYFPDDSILCVTDEGECWEE
jgi:hypothetical protein